MPWSNRKAWVFDMDGTLTHAVHDFTAIKRQLGLPTHQPILESLRAMTPARAEPIEKALADIEYEIAGEAEASPGCEALLQRLQEAGCRMGVLTRNTRRNALRTLEVSGLRSYFEDDWILGRDEAEPKPDPAGIHHLLEAWQIPARQAVMLGDAIFDLQAGRAAGVLTVYVDQEGTFEHRRWADYCVRTPEEVETLWAGVG
ncbi:HAD family hydrolase [Acanthopleuribacter pedis]|uniref:HAD family hydrolase n=1 Tax=Acanthopleuribacter pedis TaxID=442870 RepID=A0A8J7QA36_9BACT|nr:HAD family hydrolase [Acanthopleuribacter pedis]MBO1319819.1 HAD family hydrolase [Acanthopleuribacter pedis]